MGLSWQNAKWFLWLTQHGLKLGRCLTLGRQNLYMNLPEMHELTAPLGISREHVDRFLNPMPEYSERFFEMLGATSVESMDASGYEKATHIHDMNAPLPPQLAGQFDTVFDGGTLEHVFNFAQAMRNAMDLVKPGGSLILNSPCNNMVGHGFYCISPETYYRALSAQNGFAMQNLRIYERYPRSPWHEYPDPATTGRRVRLVNWGLELEVIAHAVKLRQTDVFASWPHQSDYAAAWDQGRLQADADEQRMRLGVNGGGMVHRLPAAVMRKLRDHALRSSRLGRWGKYWLNHRTVSLRSQRSLLVRSDPLLDHVKPNLPA